MLLTVLLARLKSRHIQFIALGGTIGTGLFLGIGSAFTRAGPLSVLLGYALTGLAVFAMMQCLGEVSSTRSVPLGNIDLCLDGYMAASSWSYSPILCSLC
jgi:amino acid permease